LTLEWVQAASYPKLCFQREIRQLVEAGVVSRQTVGTQTFYSANRESPVFREIKGLVTKTVGVHDVLAEALGPLRDEINLAFVYGSVATDISVEFRPTRSIRNPESFLLQQARLLCSEHDFGHG
jgi:hypothetical protein